MKAYAVIEAGWSALSPLVPQEDGRWMDPGAVSTGEVVAVLTIDPLGLYPTPERVPVRIGDPAFYSFPDKPEHHSA